MLWIQMQLYFNLGSLAAIKSIISIKSIGIIISISSSIGSNSNTDHSNNTTTHAPCPSGVGALCLYLGLEGKMAMACWARCPLAA